MMDQNQLEALIREVVAEVKRRVEEAKKLKMEFHACGWDVQWLYLHSFKGVPEADVTAECESMNTRQNLEYAKRLLPEDVRRVTVITSDYHLPRALALARDVGLDADGIGSPCRPEIGFWIKNHTREVLAWGKYLAFRILPGR